MTEKNITVFRRIVWGFYQKHRRDFPWRQTKNPYRILVSEIMLQQTQAERVERYYRQFIKQFPNLKSLASAPFSEIYSAWNGLGYNRRALFLKKTAQKVVEEFGGNIPHAPEILETFPGIGKYTARAVATFSWDAPHTFIETNIRRAYIHHFFVKKNAVTDAQLLAIAERALNKQKPREWHWALMDYGAYLKTITENPNRRHKNYTVQSKFEGSLRQVRGMILRMLSGKSMNLQELTDRSKKTTQKVQQAVDQLAAEGFLAYNPSTKEYQLL